MSDTKVRVIDRTMTKEAFKAEADDDMVICRC